MVESTRGCKGELVDGLADNVGILSHIKYGCYGGMMAKTIVSSRISSFFLQLFFSSPKNFSSLFFPPLYISLKVEGKINFPHYIYIYMYIISLKFSCTRVHIFINTRTCKRKTLNHAHSISISLAHSHAHLTHNAFPFCWLCRFTPQLIASWQYNELPHVFLNLSFMYTFSYYYF